jgi:hypothetical protein
MTIPNQLSLETLVAEDGMDVGVGLPEGMRNHLATVRNSDPITFELLNAMQLRITHLETEIAKLRSDFLLQLNKS